MLLNSESVYSDGPPPQEVLDKRWLWKVYSALLVVVFAIRLIAGDLAGAVLSGLMLCFVMVMLRDGMSDMPKYVVAYGILCILNFVLDIVPLVTALPGRVTRRTEPILVRRDNGVQQMVYRLVKRTTPFFSSEGLIYNMQSLAMLLSPAAMLMGCALSALAHFAFTNQHQGQEALLHRPSHVQEAFAAVQRLSGGDATATARTVHSTMHGLPAGVGGQGQGVGSNTAAGRGSRANPRSEDAFEHFSGRSYKL